MSLKGTTGSQFFGRHSATNVPEIVGNPELWQRKGEHPCAVCCWISPNNPRTGTGAGSENILYEFKPEAYALFSGLRQPGNLTGHEESPQPSGGLQTRICSHRLLRAAPAELNNTPPNRGDQITSCKTATGEPVQPFCSSARCRGAPGTTTGPAAPS